MFVLFRRTPLIYYTFTRNRTYRYAYVHVHLQVSRPAQEWLELHDVTVLQHVKQKLLRRIARSTGATILTSTDQLGNHLKVRTPCSGCAKQNETITLIARVRDPVTPICFLLSFSIYACYAPCFFFFFFFFSVAFWSLLRFS